MTLPLALVLAVAAPAAGGDDLQSMLVNFAPLVLIVFAGYFLLVRPQQQRARQHQQAVSGIKRGDTVVLSSGVIGKVVRVEEKEIGLELAQNVTVKVIKSMVAEVRAKGEPAAANDSKS